MPPQKSFWRSRMSKICKTELSRGKRKFLVTSADRAAAILLFNDLSMRRISAKKTRETVFTPLGNENSRQIDSASGLAVFAERLPGRSYSAINSIFITLSNSTKSFESKSSLQFLSTIENAGDIPFFVQSETVAPSSEPEGATVSRIVKIGISRLILELEKSCKDIFG